MDVRRRRWERLTRDRMVMEDFIGERDVRRETALREGAESREAVVEKVWRGNQQLEELWEEHADGIVASEPRYVEGWPVRDLIRAPRIRTVAEGGYFQPTGRRRCYQCHVKKLPCSFTKTRWRRSSDKEVRACSRCVRNGERHECIARKTDGGPWLAVDFDEKYPESVRRREEEPEELRREVEAVVKRWRMASRGIVVDIVGSGMVEVQTSAFALPLPEGWVLSRGGAVNLL
jgi:hypothetical protein